MRDDRRNLTVIKHIAVDGKSPAAKRSDFLTDRIRTLRHHVNQANVAPRSGQKKRRAFAHTLAAADDQCLFAAQAEKCRFPGRCGFHCHVDILPGHEWITLQPTWQSNSARL